MTFIRHRFEENGRLEIVQYGIKEATCFYDLAIIDYVASNDEMMSLGQGQLGEFNYIRPCYNIFMENFLVFPDYYGNIYGFDIIYQSMKVAYSFVFLRTSAIFPNKIYVPVPINPEEDSLRDIKNKRTKYRKIGIDKCDNELICFNLLACMFQRSFITFFSGALDKIWAIEDIDTLEYREKIGRQIRIVMIRYFAFCWFRNSEGNNCRFTLLAYRDALFRATTCLSDYTCLVKTGIRPLEEIVAILCGHAPMPGQAPELVVQHNYNEYFFDEHMARLE